MLLHVHASSALLLLSNAVLNRGWKSSPHHFAPHPRGAEAYLLESHRFAVKKEKKKKVTQIFYYLSLLKDNERNPRNIQCERGIAHFHESSRSPAPLDRPTSIRAPFKKKTTSLCTESQSRPKDFFPPLSSPVQLHKSLILIYIFILIWHVIRHRSHAAIGEHSDVPVNQTSWSPILYIQSNIGVLYSTVTYVWAQDIMWDWMWCSSYCRRKKTSLIVIVHSVIYFTWSFFFFKKRYIYYSILLLFTYVLGYLFILNIWKL